MDKYIEELRIITNRANDSFKDAKKSININNYKIYKLKKSRIKWSAYDYVMALELKVCPYCNRQFITPSYSEHSKMRGDLDHFFPKSRYPYLSMSIYNLVPSCKFCNSSLKGSKEFSYETHINPFEEAIDDYIKFNYTIDSVESLHGSGDIEIVVEDKLNKDFNLIKKAKNNIQVFDIVNTYNYHTDIVKNLIRKRVIYDDSYIEYLLNTHEGLFKDKNEVIQYIIKNNISQDKINQPLNKLIDDIIDELKFYNNA